MSSVVSSDQADAWLQVAVVLHRSAPTSHISLFNSGASICLRLNRFTLRRSKKKKEKKKGRPPARTLADLMMGVDSNQRVNSLAATSPYLRYCLRGIHLFDIWAAVCGIIQRH